MTNPLKSFVERLPFHRERPPISYNEILDDITGEIREQVLHISDVINGKYQVDRHNLIRRLHIASGVIQAETEHFIFIVSYHEVNKEILARLLFEMRSQVLTATIALGDFFKMNLESDYLHYGLDADSIINRLSTLRTLKRTLDFLRPGV